MIDTFDFLGGILIGTFVGSLVTLIYHMREVRQEARQNYIRLSLAQSEVITLERKLEIHRRNSVADFVQLPQDPSESENEVDNTLPRTRSLPGSLPTAHVPIRRTLDPIPARRKYLRRGKSEHSESQFPS